MEGIPFTIKTQIFNAVKENIYCLLWKSYKTNKCNLWGNVNKL